MNAIKHNAVLDSLKETLQQVYNGTIYFVTETCEEALKIIDHVLPAGQKVLTFIDERPVVTFIVVGTVVVGLVYFCGGFPYIVTANAEAIIAYSQSWLTFVASKCSWILTCMKNSQCGNFCSTVFKAVINTLAKNSLIKSCFTIGREAFNDLLLMLAQSVEKQVS